MMSGLRPIHSVETMTWTSEISGTASSGVCLIAQMPHNVRITVPVNTRNRFEAHQSMMRSIMMPALSLLLRQAQDDPEPAKGVDAVGRHFAISVTFFCPSSLPPCLTLTVTFHLPA